MKLPFNVEASVRNIDRCWQEEDRDWNTVRAYILDACGHIEVIEQKWLPIETAPKDEWILVGPTKRMGICVAMNSTRDGWVRETRGEPDSIYTPKHWMRLPEEPK